MAIGFVLVGGVSGFIAAVVTLLMGQGLWQALLNYWKVGTIALVALVIVHLVASSIRSIGTKLDAEAARRAKADGYGFGGLKPSTVEQTAFKPSQH
ncbi:MAG: hypothetical protein R8G34_03460 [Paracoccaceae bacterium]|nr:hypothetical protein [Paracoccaceae bacterium]